MHRKWQFSWILWNEDILTFRKGFCRCWKMPKATVIIDISLQNDGKFSCFWIVGCATSYHAWLNWYILYRMLAAVWQIWFWSSTRYFLLVFIGETFLAQTSIFIFSSNLKCSNVFTGCSLVDIVLHKACRRIKQTMVRDTTSGVD